MLLYASKFIHFLLNDTALYAYAKIGFIHLHADRHVDSSQFGAIKNKVAMNTYFQVFFSVLLGYIKKLHRINVYNLVIWVI